MSTKAEKRNKRMLKNQANKEHKQDSRIKDYFRKEVLNYSEYIFFQKMLTRNGIEFSIDFNKELWSIWYNHALKSNRTFGRNKNGERLYE